MRTPRTASEGHATGPLLNAIVLKLKKTRYPIGLFAE